MSLRNSRNTERNFSEFRTEREISTGSRAGYTRPCASSTAQCASTTVPYAISHTAYYSALSEPLSPRGRGRVGGYGSSSVCISPGLAASWSMVHAIVLGIAGAGRYCDGPVRFFTR